MKSDAWIAVLDTSALVAYIEGENGSIEIEKVIDNSVMSVVNLTETIIVLARKNIDKLNFYQISIDQLISNKYQTDMYLMFLASEISVKYRVSHNVSLGDAYCLALAKHLSLPVYTGDRAWSGLENKLEIEIKFIR